MALNTPPVIPMAGGSLYFTLPFNLQARRLAPGGPQRILVSQTSHTDSLKSETLGNWGTR